jgi:hypothetical protein
MVGHDTAILGKRWTCPTNAPTARAVPAKSPHAQRGAQVQYKVVWSRLGGGEGEPKWGRTDAQSGGEIQKY